MTFEYWYIYEFHGVFLIIGLILNMLFVYYYLNFESKQIVPRSKKGIDIQKKLVGLKNYLKDFSTMDTKSIKQIGLWEYYMIYALIFNIKGTLNKEAKELYNLYIRPYM